MSNNQKSTFVPNSVSTPNDYFDVVMPLLTPEEWVVLSYTIRHILGFHDRIATRTRNISLSMFERGYGAYNGCGLGKNAIIKALEILVLYELLVRIGEATAKGQEWFLNENPNIEGLKDRFLARKKADEKRTKKARGAHVGEGKNTEGGLSDKPVEVVCPTNHDRFVPQTEGGLSDKHKEIALRKPPRESVTPVENADKNAPTVGNIIQAWLTGIKAASSAKAWGEYNRMIAQDMIDAGITPADVTAFLTSPFWLGKTPSLWKVSEQIGGWKAGKSPSPLPVTKPTSLHEAWMADQLAQQEKERHGKTS